MKDKMKHRLTRLSFLLAAAIATASCSSDEPTEASSPTKQHVALQLSSVVSGMTRVSGTAWESTDKIGVFTTPKEGTMATQHGSDYDANVLYEIDDDVTGYNTATEGLLANAKAFAATTPIYLPADGSAVDVYAYHPYDDEITESGDIAVSAATASQSLATVDLMTAKTASTTDNPINALNPTVALLFSHRLSKVTVNVTNGTGYAASEITSHVSVTITGTPNTATYNLYAGTFSNFDPGKTGITLQKQATATSGYLETHSAIILPNETGNAAAAGRTLTFKVGDTANGYYTYTIPADKAFEKGKNTIYNITLSPTGLSISAAIRDWDSITTSETLK